MVESPRSALLLQAQQLFKFDTETLREIAASLDALTQFALAPVELLQDLVSLTSAEFALLPVFEAPARGRSATRPLNVSPQHARLALAKTNCLYIEWCVGRYATERRLSILDVTAFSGDIAKLQSVGVQLFELDTDPTALVRAVNDIERAHREAPVDLARRIGESGALRVQGFLWTLKLSLTLDVSLEAAAEASYSAFELDDALGGSKAGTSAE